MKLIFRLVPCICLLAGVTTLPAGDKKPQEKGVVVELDGLKSKTPDSWLKVKPANRLRSHQFKLPKAKDDDADAELAISPEQKGTPEQKIKGWQEWFEPKEEDKVESFKIGAAKATYLDIRGTYLHLPRPLAPKNQAVLKPGYRMLAVYLETKDDKFFIRLIGPQNTVAQHKAAFDTWLKGLK